MSHWHKLLDRAIRGLESLPQLIVSTEDWTLGGGTALMLQHRHRMSKDIDIFFHDFQYLPFLSPRVGGETVWYAQAYDETAHYLKLQYPEGEIDFIVSASITDIAARALDVPGALAAAIPDYVVRIEHPVEIALKKLWHRGPDLKVRDIFDISVIAEHHEQLLLANLHYVTPKKTAILQRLARINPDFFLASIDELDILPDYMQIAKKALTRAQAILERI